MARDRVSSQTETTEASLLKGVIQALEVWDIAMLDIFHMHDIPNAFVETEKDEYES